MRLFTGISLSPDVLSKVEDTLEILRPLAPIRWSPAANLHITTKFIGEWPENRLNELRETLEGLPRAGRIRIRVAGLGFLPEARHPKVFFAGVDGGEPLPALARQTNEALEPLGCATEDRPYRPHLTLARIKNENVSSLRSWAEAHAEIDFGWFEAASFHLYLSKTGSGGSVYTELGAWSLA